MKTKMIMLLLTSLMGVTNAFAQAPANTPANTLTICAGADGGRYQEYVANLLKTYNDGRRTHARALTTGGSFDNIDGIMTKRCGGGMMQYDVMASVIASRPQAKLSFEVAARPFVETVHLICNRISGVYTLSDIEKRSKEFIVITGNESGGSYFTWQRIASTSQNLMSIPTSARSGLRAVNTVSEEGTMDAPDGTKRNVCMIWVGAAGSQVIKNDVETRSSKLRLISLDNEKILELKGPKGENLYTTFNKMHESYPNLLSEWKFKTPVSVTVPAMLVFDSEWIDANESEYNRLTRLINSDKTDKKN